MKNFSHTIFYLFAPLIIGAGSGVIAALSTARSLDNYAAQLLDERRFAALSPNKLPLLAGSYDESVKNIRENSTRAVGVILPATTDSLVVADLLSESDILGSAVVVSADGWLVTTVQSWPLNADMNRFQVWVEGERYDIEQVVRDEVTPLVLIKLKNASQLPTVGFADSSRLLSGDSLFAVSGAGQTVQPLTLLASDAAVISGSLLAETFATSWQIEAETLSGVPLFAGNGDLLGFSLSDGAAFPLHQAGDTVQEIVRSGAPSRAYLGAYVIDLSRAYNLSPTLKSGRAAGALIIAPNAVTKAVIKNSPAEVAGLVPGDILLEVDGQALSKNVSLAEILALYDAGEIANFKVLRGGEVLTVPVTLGGV